MASLLDRDPHGVKFHELEVFLQAGHVESERIEYKSKIVDSVAHTLVAMANMDGGLIMGGVVEDKGKPISCDGLDQKDPLDALANQNSAVFSTCKV